MRRKNPLAFLAAIFGVTALAWTLGYAAAPQRILGAPDFSSVFLQARHPSARCSWRSLPAMVAIMFTDLFDSLSTFIGVAKAAGLTDAGWPAAQPAARPDRRRLCDARRRARRHVTRHRLRRKHRRHPHGRAHRHDVGRDGALLPALLLHRAAGRRRARLCDGARAGAGRRGDVPGSGRDRLRAASRTRCRRS